MHAIPGLGSFHFEPWFWGAPPWVPCSLMPDLFDVIVLGGGAWGSAVTQHLAMRNRRVLCLDQFVPPHGKGSSHGRSRVIRPGTSLPEQNGPLIQRAFELWHRLERDSHTALLQLTGFLSVGTPESERIANLLEGYIPLSVPHKVMSPPEVAQQFPRLRLEANEIGLYEPEAGRLDPEACVHAALELATRHGASLRFGERADDWTADANEIAVSTSKGKYRASWLVLALGPWTSGLLKVDLPLWVERQVTVWYRDTEGGLPILSFPAQAPAHSLYGVPEPNGFVKFAFHHGGTAVHPESVPSVTAAEVTSISSLVRERCPDLMGVAESATCMYTNTPDYQYVIGRHPDSARVIVAAGGSGRGFHQAQVVGEMVANYVEGRPIAQGSFMSPDRFRDRTS